MAECLPYAAGGRFPIVMMNANRSTALPWNIYGDQRDSLSQLDSGWIQMYVEDAQESLDMALMSYYIAEHTDVMVPVMVNLDGFVLTHTYEAVDIPTQSQADEFLPTYVTDNKMDLDNPVNMGFSVGPADNEEFHLLHHKAMLRVKDVVKEADERFKKIFGRSHGTMTQGYRIEDAEYILITLGSITGIAREVVDELRDRGVKVGVLKIRFVRPFPHEEIAALVKGAKAIGTLEKDISFEELKNAAILAGAYDFIEELPQKFDTIIGERGRNLSGGQKQRIAVARAILRNPDILLFDEATASLDTKSEKIIQESVNKVKNGKIVFVIAHRLSTVVDSDKILVMQDGKITGCGAHQELLSSHEFYNNLVNQQFVENKESV